MENVDYEARLRNLMEKYRQNRQKVPLQVLKTRYKEAFHRLRLDMLEVAYEIALRPPDWMWEIRPPTETWKIMIALFRRSFAEAGSGLMLRKALFLSMDADLAIETAERMNREAVAAWDKYLYDSCRYVSWGDESGGLSQPRQFSPLLRSVRTDRGWGRLSAEEPVPDFRHIVDAEIYRWQSWMPEREEHGPDKRGREM